MMKYLVYILLILLVACKSTKHTLKTNVKRDSITMSKVDSVQVKKSDSFIHFKVDSSLANITVIDFNYDSLEKMTYVSKVTLYSKQNNKKEVIQKGKKVDSVQVEKENLTALRAAERHIQRDKEVKGIRWFNWLLLIPLVVIVLVIIKYWSKIRAFVKLIRPI